jgi:ADP-heptose:LPS heptosyltransferase
MNPWLEARNLLAIRLDNMGDMVMLGPALRAIKDTSPAARVTVLASPAGARATTLLPWLDDVMTWEPVWQDTNGRLPQDPLRERRLIDQIAERSFDGALVFTSFSQDPHVPGYVCYLAGIPLRAGESKEFAGGTLTTELSSAPDSLHQTERNLRLIESLGFSVRDRSLRVVIPPQAYGKAQAKLGRLGIGPDEPYVLLHPGASCQSRRYSAERYGDVAGRLGARGWTVLVTGSEREAELAATILDRAPRARSLVGDTDLQEYAALIDQAAAVICGNTLPLHLADALRTPLVSLYSGTDLEDQWRPRQTAHLLLRQPTECHPCYRFECPLAGHPCLDIQPDLVVKAVERLLRPVGDVRINHRNHRTSDRARLGLLPAEHGLSEAWGGT